MIDRHGRVDQIRSDQTRPAQREFRAMREEAQPFMRQIQWIAACLLGIVAHPTTTTTLPATPTSKDMRLEVTRDTWVSEVGPEADGNNGGASRLKLKGIQEMSLIDVDPAPLRGRVIREATLHLKLAGGEPLRRVTVGGIGAEWFEGTGSGYARQPGGATFRHRRHPDLAWSSARPGGDLCHVILGNGGTNWGMADASQPDSDGWQTIPVEPVVVAARAAGLSHGFLVFDDTGSEWTRDGQRFTFHLFPNRFVYSRDQNRASAPYLTVSLGSEDLQPPAAPTGLRAESHDLPPGEAIASWVTPGDQGPAGTLGFVATLDGQPIPRELIPLAGAPGKRVEMHLRDLGLENVASTQLSVKAVDSAGNVGPPASGTIRLSSRKAEPLPGALPHVPRGFKLVFPSPSFPRGAPIGPYSPRAWKPLPRAEKTEVAVIDELDKVDPVSDAIIPPQDEEYVRSNHLWKAADRQVTLYAARNEFVAFQVLVRGRKLADDVELRPEMTFDARPGAGKIQVSFGRYHLVPTPGGPLPDPIVPLGVVAPSLPRGAGAGRTAHPLSKSLHVELYVPHDVPAGEHRGTLSLRVGQERFLLSVKLTVWDFTLPDHLSFLPEMNCYGLPENERAYYRMAHRHRTVLNRLPYNQNGRIPDGCAPRWDGTQRAFDWSAWDRRFGPLLDGSAFADLARKGVPVECFYLPLHENWPSPMEGNYNGSYWADQAFPDSYRRAFVTASRQIAEHFRDKGWNDTLFHGFLNNKVDFKKAGWARGSSPWLLDEPASFQDYWALRYFARAFHEGINQARPKSQGVASASTGSDHPHFPRLVFRADISRPQWRRDALDGLLDYHVVGSAMREYPRLVFGRKRAFGEIVVEYGGTNPVEASNFQPVGWSLDAWSLGADGVLPWQTVGTSESWRRGDELALFYPLPGAEPGVVPSIRLKAYRRGQQDVEYLELWSRHRGLHLPRWAIGRQVRQNLHLAGSRQATATEPGGAEDAGRIDYSQLRPQDLWALRIQLGQTLSELHPAPRSRLVEFRTPPRTPEHRHRPALPNSRSDRGFHAGSQNE
jgi:hypothetical protein